MKSLIKGGIEGMLFITLKWESAFYLKNFVIPHLNVNGNLSTKNGFFLIMSSSIYSKKSYVYLLPFSYYNYSEFFEKPNLMSWYL